MKNKELTKRKLINAVGTILQTEGFACLGVNNIARKAGVSKKMIYRYFGGIDQHIEAYVVERDYIHKSHLTTYKTTQLSDQIVAITLDNFVNFLKSITFLSHI